MKKVFAVIALAGIMVACNNSGDKKEGDKDSAAILDSMKKAMDATKDTVNKMMDATKDTMNKMIDKAKDSVK